MHFRHRAPCTWPLHHGKGAPTHTQASARCSHEATTADRPRVCQHRTTASPAQQDAHSPMLPAIQQHPSTAPASPQHEASLPLSPEIGQSTASPARSSHQFELSQQSAAAEGAVFGTGDTRKNGHTKRMFLPISQRRSASNARPTCARSPALSCRPPFKAAGTHLCDDPPLRARSAATSARTQRLLYC